MAFRVKGSPSAPATSRAAAQIPQTSEVGKQPPSMSVVGNAPKPVRSRRDYGKTAPSVVAPAVNPFGPTQRGL